MKIAIVGLGTLGCKVANNLIKQNIESLKLFDRDIVEKSNLDVQILYDEGDIGKPKAIQAIKKLTIDNDIKLESFISDINSDTIDNLKSDFIFDCTDVKSNIISKCKLRIRKKLEYQFNL